MSWVYIVLGVAAVVVVLNLALLFVLAYYSRAGTSSNAENQNH